MSLKDLHDDWKKAKKDAKSIYDHWARLFTDVTRAHEKVTSTVPDFPKFDKDLGPSLEALHKNKDVEKWLKKAETAIKQYKKDVKELEESVAKKREVLPKTTAEKGKLTPNDINEGFGKFVEKLTGVLEEIEEAVSDYSKEHEKSEKKKK